MDKFLQRMRDGAVTNREMVVAELINDCSWNINSNLLRFGWRLFLVDFVHWDSGKAYVATLCWFIWKVRCKMVFEMVEPNPQVAIDLANQSINEYWDANALFAASILPAGIQNWLSMEKTTG